MPQWEEVPYERALLAPNDVEFVSQLNVIRAKCASLATNFDIQAILAEREWNDKELSKYVPGWCAAARVLANRLIEWRALVRQWAERVAGRRGAKRNPVVISTAYAGPTEVVEVTENGDGDVRDAPLTEGLPPEFRSSDCHHAIMFYNANIDCKCNASQRYCSFYRSFHRSVDSIILQSLCRLLYYDVETWHMDNPVTNAIH